MSVLVAIVVIVVGLQQARGFGKPRRHHKEYGSCMRGLPTRISCHIITCVTPILTGTHPQRPTMTHKIRPLYSSSKDKANKDKGTNFTYI